MSDQNTPADRLKKLIELLLEQQLDVSTFCEQFESIYNFELERNHASPEKWAAFEELFNKVVYYSPFPEEREKIPNYLSEQEIIEAANVARNKLQQQA